MAKSLRKRLEEEGKWKQIESTMKTTPKNSNSNNASVKTMVDNVYNKSTESTWDRVLNRANQLMNDAGNVFSNFGLGIKKSGESALYYIEKMTAGRNAEYQNKVWSKDRKEQVNKKIEEQFNTNKSNDELKLVTKNDFKLQEELNVNPLLYKSELLKNYENPILRNIQENIKEDETEIKENIDNTEGKIMKKVAELTPSIGQSVAGMGASVINPGLGIAFWQTSAGGDYVRDAKARGMNDDDALLYGTIMGGMESATEWIGGELTKGVGKAFTKDGVIKGLKALGLDIGENFFEEAIIEPLQETVATMTGGKETADWSDMTKRMLQSGIDGALTSILMGGASAGVGKAVKLVNKYSKGEKVSQQEIKEALEEINSKEELDIEKILVNNFGFNSQDLYKNATVQQNLENKMNNISSELSQNEIKGILLQKPPVTIENNGVLNTNQQTIQNEQKISQNQTSQQLQQNSKYSIKMPNSNYKFIKSGDEKIDNFRQDVSQNWNNSKDTQKLVSTIETIMKDKGVAVRLDANLKDSDGNIADGKYENGTITINPNSKRAFEHIATHELTHAIGTKQMLDMVQRYRQDNKEFNSKVETLLKNYNATELTEEALADVSAQLFGTQEFIANVKNTNPNLFQKIYNEIKYLWHQFRGYKNQNQFIEDLYNKWTQAYNSNTKLNQTNKYMIAGKKAMNNAISQDSQYKVIENSYNKALQMANQKIDNEIIRQETNWFQDKNGDWKFEFSDKDMKLKNIKFENNKTYKLEDVLEHDILFLLYPELKKYNIEFNDIGKYGGKIFIDKNTIQINSNKFKKRNPQISIQSTLIHEIQHAVQKIEGFEGGANAFFKEAYYKSLGEIEANDTKRRYILEQKGKINRKEVAPESSKKNPKHLEYDDYMKNRKLFDKIKDGIYNYFSNKNNKGDINYEEDIELDSYFEEQNTQKNNPEIFSTQRMDNTKDGNGLGLRGEGRGRIINKKNSTESSFSMQKNKEKQFEIIQKINPMTDDYHVGIRNIEDIKTFDEVINDEESFVWGDFSREDAQKALEKGSITIYSSYPIEDGVFVSTSRNQAKDYAGSGKIYSKEVLLDDIAWINGDEGQYAKIKENKVVDNKGRELTKEQQEYFMDSKVRDENGNLMEVYHGTSEEFNVFDISYLGSASGDIGFLGDGFYFATHEGEAKYYGEKIKKVYLNVTNPYNIKNLKMYNNEYLTGESSNEFLEIRNLVDLNEEWGNIKINSTSFKEINEAVNDYLENVEIKDAGIGEDYYGEEARFWEITYNNKKDVINSIPNYTKNEILADSLNNEMRNKFGYINSNDILQYITEEKKFNNGKSFSDVLKEKGYDGIIQGKYASQTDEIVVFDANKIKNIDNTKPTSNDDIRYSKENKEWQEYLEKNFKSEGTRTFIKDVKTTEMDTDTNSSQEEKTYNPSRKAQNYEKRQKSVFKRNMSNMLGISQFNQKNKTLFDTAIDELRTEYNTERKISSESKDRIFNKLYDGLIKEDRAYYDENKEIKDTIRNTTLFVSDKTKADITDYADFKKSIFGNIRISNNKTDTKIDTFYQELSNQRPDLFPNDIYTTSEQLQRIAEISKSIRKSERNISAYNDETMSAEYRKWAKNEFETQVSQLIKQFAYIDKYNDTKQAEFEKKNQPYIKPDVEEIKFIYKNRAELRKEVEKQERNLLLTNREKAIVDRLLKDEMDIEEILPGYNKDAIIKSYYARQQLNYLDSSVKEYKKHKKQELINTMDSLTSGIKNWKDKKIGLQYSRETAIRNIRDIMDKEEAQRINKQIFEPIIHNTSEQTRMINSYNERIESLDLDKKAKYEWKDSDGKTLKIDEATLAQLLIEKKVDKNYLKKIGADVNKIEKTAKTFSEILEELVDQMDNVYVEFGYAPVERRKNYFPHFLENKPDTLMSKLANALGFRIDTDSLTTDIAGRTETFKPGRAFDRNILRRTTEKTDYNALKALDMYLQGASDIIYHTEDIQKLRAFSESIRDKFKDTEIKKKILEINENPELTEAERENKIDEIKENIKTPLNGLVTWLDEYTNLLANKKSSGDRQLEKDLNRQMYTTMQEIEGRIASNLIGGNLSVSLTNFAPLAQAMGTTKVGNILVGMIQTVQNTINETHNKGDNFVYESDFLTSRRGTEQTQKQTLKQNVSNALGTPMEVVDSFTSEVIVRAKYRENIKNGMEHEEALRKADEYARNLIADRSKGALPTIFARKNPISKLMTSFQVEPNNIISNYFKDMPVDAETKTKLAGQVVKLSIASWAFNTVLKSIRGGSDVIPNPIGIVSQLIGLAISNLNDDEEDDKDVSETLTNIASDILGSIPFGTALASGLTAIGVEGLEDTGKFMVSNAVPSIPKISSLFDSKVSNEYKKQVIANELTKPLIYLGLPTGGSQLSKTAKGLYSYSQGGSYTYDKDGNKKIQFPIEQNAENLMKSTVFGKYSLPTAQKYIDSDFKSLSGKETELYDNSNIDYEELKDYLNYSKKDKIKKADKINYIDNMELSESDKWNIYSYNIVSSTEREDGTSQLSDAEYIIENKMATKSEYMKLYSEAEKNEVEFPSTETIKELNEMDLSLQSYMEYKTELKKANAKKKAEYEKQQKSKLPVSEEEAEKSKTLNTSEKISLIQNEKYTDRERELIYANYISKEDETYQCLKLANNNLDINQYLDFRQSSLDGDFDSDRKDDGTKKGKTITNSAKNKYVKYLNNSNFTSFEKLFLYGSKYTMDSSERSAFTKYINKLKITPGERKEIYLELSSQNVVEMKDGSIKWK